MVKPSNISKVFHRNAQVLALLNGEDASKLDWQDTIWFGLLRIVNDIKWYNIDTTSMRFESYDRRDDVQRIMTGIFHARKKVIQFWSDMKVKFLLFLRNYSLNAKLCHIVSDQPHGFSSLTAHVWAAFPIQNRLVTSNNRPNPSLFNSLNKYSMLGSKPNPRSSL